MLDKLRVTKEQDGQREPGLRLLMFGKPGSGKVCLLGGWRLDSMSRS